MTKYLGTVSTCIVAINVACMVVVYICKTVRVLIWGCSKNAMLWTYRNPFRHHTKQNTCICFDMYYLLHTSMVAAWWDDGVSFHMFDIADAFGDFFKTTPSCKVYTIHMLRLQFATPKVNRHAMHKNISIMQVDTKSLTELVIIKRLQNNCMQHLTTDVA